MGDYKNDYYKEIEDEADEFMNDHEDELLEIIKENKDQDEDYIFDEAIYQSWDIHDKIHEQLDNNWHGFLRRDWLKEYDSELTSCARILDESNEVETDGGLWEKQEPREAINTQAFFTVRGDLYWELESKIKELIKNERSKK